MKPKYKEIIYSQLKEAQEKYGGYTGKDIAIKKNQQTAKDRKETD